MNYLEVLDDFGFDLSTVGQRLAFAESL